MRAKYILPWKRSRSSNQPKRCEPTRALLFLCSDIAAEISKRLAASSFYHKTAQRFSILFYVILFGETSSHPLAAIISRRCRTLFFNLPFLYFLQYFLYFISRDTFQETPNHPLVAIISRRRRTSSKRRFDTFCSIFCTLFHAILLQTIPW